MRTAARSRGLRAVRGTRSQRIASRARTFFCSMTWRRLALVHTISIGHPSYTYAQLAKFGAICVVPLHVVRVVHDSPFGAPHPTCLFFETSPSSSRNPRRPPRPPTPQPPKMTEELPVGLQLARVHNFLRAELEPFTSAEIHEKTGVDIDGNTDVLLSLTGEASKVIREKDGRWRWASKYQLRNFTHLLSLMARSSDGLNEKDLYDSYKGVKDDIKKLKKRRAVYQIKSGSKLLLFPHDPRLDVPVSDEVKKRYKHVLLPDAIETHRILVANGLKEADDKTGIRISQPVARKRPSSRPNARRRAKRIKLTNTHMANSAVDLTKDYDAGKSSAFS